MKQPAGQVLSQMLEPAELETKLQECMTDRDTLQHRLEDATQSSGRISILFLLGFEIRRVLHLKLPSSFPAVTRELRFAEVVEIVQSMVFNWVV